MPISYRRTIKNLAIGMTKIIPINSLFVALPHKHSSRILENEEEKERVHKLVRTYGQNPMSYLAMEHDKFYFFGKQVDGVCAYTVVGRIMVVCGDMICPPQEGETFLMELLAFCKGSHYDLVLLNVTEAFLDLYKASQFGVLKYGEDACFDLNAYNLKGGAVAKVRAAINHANKAGIVVREYKPLVEYDAQIEMEIQNISQNWLRDKALPEMRFMLGGIGLDSPRERRYFYALDSDGRMLGFVVFLPYLGGKAYLADVTRRRNDAPQGVLEKIIYDAFMVMKDEGVQIGNLGLSPLYNITSNDKQTISKKVSEYIYEHVNEAYDFKALHHAKEKYAPTGWEPRYIAYFPKSITLKYAYAIVKAQNPVKFSTIIRLQIKKPKTK